MTKLKKFFLKFHQDDDGSVIVPSLMVLALVTIIGVMAIRTSGDDIKISTNQQLFERSFYSAESAKAFARNDPVLYGAENIIPRGIIGFPKVEPIPKPTPLPSENPLLYPTTSEQDRQDVSDMYESIKSSNLHQILISAGIPPTITVITVAPAPAPNGTSFRGSVEYLTSSLPPRGSGFAVVKFRAHNYRMVCEGHFSGVSDTTSQVEAGFYRIGF